MRNSIRKRSAPKRENLVCRKIMNFLFIVRLSDRWMKQAEQTFSIQMLRVGSLQATPIYTTKQEFLSFAYMLPVKVSTCMFIL